MGERIVPVFGERMDQTAVIGQGGDTPSGSREGRLKTVLLSAAVLGCLALFAPGRASQLALFAASATCSVLTEENGARIAQFLSVTPGWRCILQQSTPITPENDGFFTSHLTRDSRDS